VDTAAEYAPYLLQLVDANGLQNLQSVVLNYIVSHYDTVSNSSAYRQLSKREVDMITMECFKMLKRFKELLQDLSNKDMSSILAS